MINANNMIWKHMCHFRTINISGIFLFTLLESLFQTFKMSIHMKIYGTGSLKS
jgi:hypothetical protein